MEDIQHHMPSCQFANGNMPAWFAAYMNSKEKDFERDEELEEQDDEEEGQDAGEHQIIQGNVINYYYSIYILFIIYF